MPLLTRRMILGKSRIFKTPLILAVTVVGLALVALVLPVPPSAIERVYSRLVYPPLQRLMTSISNLAPFPLFDLLLVGFPLLWVVLIGRDVMRADRWLTVLRRWVLRTATAAAIFYLVFLTTWGLNYRRLPLERKLRYDSSRVSADTARDAAVLSV